MVKRLKVRALPWVGLSSLTIPIKFTKTETEMLGQHQFQDSSLQIWIFTPNPHPVLSLPGDVCKSLPYLALGLSIRWQCPSRALQSLQTWRQYKATILNLSVAFVGQGCYGRPHGY